MILPQFFSDITGSDWSLRLNRSLHTPGVLSVYLASFLDALTLVISLYLGIKGFIEDEKWLLLGWTIFCLIAVVIARLYGTADPKKNKSPQLLAVLISCVSYVLWVHSSGDIFTLLGFHYPKIGSMLVAGWVFLVPFFYKGDRATSNSNS